MLKINHVHPVSRKVSVRFEFRAGRNPHERVNHGAGGWVSSIHASGPLFHHQDRFRNPFLALFLFLPAQKARDPLLYINFPECVSRRQHDQTKNTGPIILPKTRFAHIQIDKIEADSEQIFLFDAISSLLEQCLSRNIKIIHL